jgi:aquaporin Z
MYKKYIAEAIGTFALSFVVLAAVSSSGAIPIPVPVLAGLTLALFVYTIGSISGCHINPAVTLGLLSIKKIIPTDAAGYIVAQMLGALGAVFLAKSLLMISPVVVGTFSSTVFFAEMLGTFFFTFGIASVVYGKAKEQMSGVVVGWSLLFGILVASLAGASGILNPAVAFALNSVSVIYILAPIVGSVLGFQVYKYLVEGR